MKKDFKVIKRNGEVVPFDISKIKNAIIRAFDSTNFKYENNDIQKVLLDVVSKLDNGNYSNILSIEQIQDVVEHSILDLGYIAVGLSFVKYRSKHETMRNINDIVKSVYHTQDTGIINENANIDGQTNTAQRDFVVSEVAKKWALETYLPKDVAQAHINGEIYYHDLGFAPLGSYINCCLVNVKDMLDKGFTMGSANVTKPKSLRVACNIVSQIITAVSSQNYGGTTVNRIDEVLDEYVMLSYNYYKDKYKALDVFTNEQINELAWKDTEFEAKNSFKQLEYSINCSHNSHSQVPFVTLGFGLGTTKGARLIQKCILNTRFKGLGKEGKTSIFPKLTFTLRDGVNLNPNDPNYDIKQLALKCTAKRMYPDYLMYDKLVELTGAFKACMGRL